MFDDLFEEESTIDLTKEDTYSKDYDETTKSKPSKKKRINVFKDQIEPIPIDTENVKVNNVFTLVIGSHDMKITDDMKDILDKVFKVLAEKGYRIRLFCNAAKPFMDIIKKHFDNSKITLISPWKSYCKATGYKIYTPSDLNIQNAAMYIKNFDKLPPGIKSIYAAYMAVLFGLYGNDQIKFGIIVDPFSTIKKIDFKNSTVSSNLLWTVKSINGNEINIPIFNVLHKDDLKSLKSLLQ